MDDSDDSPVAGLLALSGSSLRRPISTTALVRVLPPDISSSAAAIVSLRQTAPAVAGTAARRSHLLSRRNPHGIAMKDCETSSLLQSSAACPPHIDPRKLIGCPSASSVCCSSTSCGPPKKRRATDEEMHRVDQQLGTTSSSSSSSSSSHIVAADCDQLSWETLCNGVCDTTPCSSPLAVDCSGDDHCNGDNLCFDPDCEGTPCFGEDCRSPTCTEPSCPDNNCQAKPCYDENCLLDHPWDACSMSAHLFPEGTFNYDPNWWEEFDPCECSVQSQGAQDQNFTSNGPCNSDHCCNFLLQSNDTQKCGHLIDPSVLQLSLPPNSNALLPQDDVLAAASLAGLQHNASMHPQLGHYHNPQHHVSRNAYAPLHQHRHHNGSASVHSLENDFFSRPSNSSQTPSSSTSPTHCSPSHHSMHQSPIWPVDSTVNVHPYNPHAEVNFDSLSYIQLGESSVPLDTKLSHSLSHDTGVSDAQAATNEQFVCKWVDSASMSSVVCNHQCKDSLALQTHIRDAHLTNKMDEYRCQWLGCSNKNDFKLRSKLERHMQTHTKHRPHQCDWPGCGKSFGTKQTLDNHLKTHTQDKPYKCRFCNATATTQTQIKTHENSVHEKKKLFPCRFPGCSHVATDSSNLSKHEKTHKGWARTFYCPEPGCTYKPDCRWENLKRHWVKTGHCSHILSNVDLQNQFREKCNEAAKREDLAVYDFLDKTLMSEGGAMGPPRASKRSRDSTHEL